MDLSCTAQLRLHKTHHVQEALRALSANTHSPQESQESSWSSHLQLPDVVVQHGTGPHNVIYADTKGIYCLITQHNPCQVDTDSTLFS